MVYDEDGELYRKYLRTYDSNDNRTEELKCFPNDNLDKRYVYKYNSNGDLTLYRYYNVDGSIAWSNKWKYKYDKAGNWISKTLFLYTGVTKSRLKYF